MSDNKNLVQGETGLWEVVIGLEVHAQVVSKSKLFSSAPVSFGEEPNASVSFVDAAIPGVLPVLNRFCVEQAIKTGMGLNAQINLESRFDRKNYFYADLPQGYQISQFEKPIVGKGELEIELEDGTVKTIGVTRLHLEQDAGKSFHEHHPQKTYIDLNRSGIALMEIVSEPDIRSAEEAAAYVKKLRTILRYLGTCDGNMEEGSMRCDVNVSVRRLGEPLGTRAEIKNVNSVRFLMQAVQFEVSRQIDILESGGSIVQETRLFDANKGETRSMRSKEDTHDYRYFPDPDLPLLVLDEAQVARIRDELPELPDAKKKRFMNDFALSSYEAGLLTSEREIANFYEQALAASQASDKKQSAKLVANWMMGDFFAALNRDGLNIDESKVDAKNLAGLVDLILDNTLSGKLAKDVFVFMWETSKSAAVIVEEKGLRQVTDTSAIEAMIDQVLSSEAEKVAEYRSGKDKLFGYFVGQVMRVMAGKGNPAIVNDILKKKLSA